MATRMVAELIVGTVTCFAVAELSRLTRDDRGFDAAYLGGVIKKYADGKLITYEKVFDLRKPSDWELYQTLSRISAWQRRDITSAMASGFAKALEKGPMFRSWLKLGYKRVQLHLPDGSVAVDRYGRVRTTIEKDEGQAGVMARLALELDQQPTLSGVGAAMNRARVPAPWKPKVGGAIWSGERISAIIADPVYAGTWRFNHGGVDPVFWQPFARERFDPTTIEHPVQHLAWYTPEQMARWGAKFLGKPKPYRRSLAAHEHLLLGVLRCGECESDLQRNGHHGYRCPMYRRGCTRAAVVSEKMALRALEARLPEFLSQTEYVMSAVWATLATVDGGDIDARLAEIEEREQYLLNEWVRAAMVDPPQWIHDEAQRLATDKRRLRAERTAKDELRNLEIRAAEVRTLFECDPAAALARFAEMSDRQKAAVFRTLITGAKLCGHSKGMNRRVWVEEWTSVGQEAFGD